MTVTQSSAQSHRAAADRGNGRRVWRRIEGMVPAIVLALMLILIFVMRPNVMTYGGINLLLKLAVPLVLAALSQMLIISLGDLDLSTGSFVSFSTCVIAVFLDQQPGIAIAILAASVLAYGLLGAVIHLRQLPSIIVTLGMSFVWLGIALLILSSPGGRAPEWLISFPRLAPPLLPFPVWFAVIVAVIFEIGLMHSSLGVIVRGAGGNPRATERAGWSVLAARVGVYMAAGFCAVLSGLMLSALTTSGAPNIAPSYTLLSIAAVILGGGSFIGGVVSPAGAVIGAITLTLVGSVLTFLSVPPVWQIGAQGGILILVLLGRGLERFIR
jgi:ribose transport system permease protein